MKQLHPVGLAIRFARFSAASIPLSRSSRMLLSCAALLLGTFVQSASHKVNAGLITFYYEAEIDSISANLDTSGLFQVGDKVSGSYTFESTTPNSGVFAGNARYEAITSIDFSVGDYAGSATSGLISVISDFSFFDRYAVVSTGPTSAPAIGGQVLSSFGLTLDEDTRSGSNAISSDQLPLSPPQIEEFSRRAFVLNFNFAPVYGTITSVSDIAPDAQGVVPEPSSCLIFAMGICGLVVRRRRS